MEQKKQNVSWDEAEQVVRLHRKNSGMPSSVSVRSLSAALGLNEDETQGLLAQVRRTSSRNRNLLGERTGVVSLALAAMLLIALGVASLAAWGPGAKSNAVAAIKTPVRTYEYAATLPRVYNVHSVTPKLNRTVHTSEQL